VTTETVEEYLKTIYQLAKKGKKVTTTEIAKRLKISPVSVSEMLKRLSMKNYLKFKPYKGVTLTKKGKAIAKKVSKKGELLEDFLKTLGLSKHKIRKEACKLEHYVSDELEGLIKSKMEPKVSKKGILSLIDLKEEEEGEIFSIDTGASSRRRLEEMGLTPGTKIKIKKSAPFRGPVEISVRGSTLAIGRGIASKIFVKR
jgi:DtxR family Mn-dependent transcriptional regulator